MRDDSKHHPTFGDRRNRIERRKQNLSVPEGLCRRKGNRRMGNAFSFNRKPWWLKVQYVEEFVPTSESDSADISSDVQDDSKIG